MGAEQGLRIRELSKDNVKMQDTVERLTADLVAARASLANVQGELATLRDAYTVRGEQIDGYERRVDSLLADIATLKARAEMAEADLQVTAKAAQRAMGIHGPCENNSCSACTATWEHLRAVIEKGKATRAAGGA